MHIETFRPKNQELQKYIESYYILKHSKEETNISYLAFPSICSIVSVVNNAENIISQDYISVKPSQLRQLDTSLVCRFNNPICFKYQGDIKEITISFKSLGLNAFLNNPLKDYSNSFFGPFIPFSDYEKEMKTIIEIEDNTLLAESLEKYWVAKLKGFRHPFLNNAVSIIEEQPKISTLELANEFNISRKTLIKHFKHHICKTPTEYKKILRFRRTMEEMRTIKKATTLTELSYIADFFDQSHMTTSFKSLTGLPPRIFFKNLTTIQNSNIQWIFN